MNPRQRFIELLRRDIRQRRVLLQSDPAHLDRLMIHLHAALAAGFPP